MLASSSPQATTGAHGSRLLVFCVVAYRLQIVREDGEAVRFRPGTRSEEGDFVAAVTARISAKGVGVGRTAAQVTRAIAEGFSEVFADLKQNVQP
jgi:hypothetical protein